MLCRPSARRLPGQPVSVPETASWISSVTSSTAKAMAPPSSRATSQSTPRRRNSLEADQKARAGRP
jgi:hypothetical protein